MIKRLLLDNVLLGAQYLAAALVPLLLIPHIVRTFGAATFGKVAIGVAVTSYAAVIVQYGFHLTGPAELARLSDKRSVRNIFVEIAWARAILFCLVLAVALPLIAIFAVGWPLLQSQLRSLLILLLIPLGAALNAGWLLQATGKFRAIAMIAIASTAATLGLGFWLVKAGASDPSFRASLAIVLSPILNGLATFTYAHWSLRHTTGRATRAGVLLALHGGWGVFASQFVASLYALAGPIVIGAFAGARAAGLYAAVERAANALQGALQLTHTAAYPRLASLYETARSQYRQLAFWVVAIYLVGTFVLGILIVLSPGRIALFLTGDMSMETLLLIGCAYVWIGLGIFGPLVTGYFTISAQRSRILPLTLQILTVSLIGGLLSVAWIGPSGWFIALALGQCVTLWKAIQMWDALRNHQKPRSAT